MSDITDAVQAVAEFPNRVRGRVTTTDGDLPLSSVVVVAHDFDPYRLVVLDGLTAGDAESVGSTGRWRTEALGRLASGLIEPAEALAEFYLAALLGRIPGEPALPDLRSLLFPFADIDDGLRQLPEFDAGFDPMWMMGQRIGSTIPDANGWFELSYDPEAVRVRDLSGRPDLLLSVLAPATATSRLSLRRQDLALTDPVELDIPVTGSPFGRLLALTFTGRANVGAESAYLIRVERSRASAFDLVAPAYVEPNDDERALKLEERRQDVSARRDALENLRDPTGGFSGVPAAVRNSPLFIAQLTNLSEVMARESVKPIVDLLTARGGAKVPLLVPPAIFAQWEAHPTAVNTQDGIQIEVDPCELLRGPLDHRTLSRIRELGELLEPAPKNGLAGAAPAVPPPNDKVDIAINRKVLGALSDPVRAANELTAQTEADETVDAIRNTSAADAVAIHDHNVLRIAFDSAWTEAFDRNALGSAASAYGEAVRLHKDLELEYDPDYDDAAQLSEDLALVDRAFDDVTPLPVPDDVQALSNWITPLNWGSIDEGKRSEILWNAERIAGKTPIDENSRNEFDRYLLEAVRDAGGSGPGRLGRFLSDLADQLAEPHSFKYFAPNSWNFGVVLTYRQDWIPLSYQVGDLVATIPMTPGEKRTYTTKHSVQQNRKRQEVEKRSEATTSEEQVTSRAQSEVTRKATQSTSFEMSANSEFSFGFGSASVSSGFKTSAAQESASSKKSFREGIRKASQEYKAERTIQLESEDSFERSTETVIEITNPNNEITVTYLLYELERQFKLRERLHRLQPVVMIARDIPSPDEIDEVWLLRYAWILERVLLDASFAQSLDYLSDGFVGNAVERRLRETAFDEARSQLRTAEFTLDDLVNQRDVLKNMKAMTVVEILKEEMGEDEYKKWKDDLGVEASFNLLGGIVPRKRRVSSTNRYKQAARRKSLATDELKEMDDEGVIEKAQGGLTASQRAYADAVESWAETAKLDQTKLLAIGRLRMHVKDNILYYMQAIWDHEVPDQRFFELADVEVTVHKPSGPLTVTTAPGTPDPQTHLEELVAKQLGDETTVVEVELPPPDPAGTPEKLRDVADLNSPLGYFGNYAVFPLTACTYVTDYLMSDYVDSYYGLRDPDPFGQFSNEDLQLLIERVNEEAEAGESELLDEEVTQLNELIKTRLQHPSADFEHIALPTGQLFMEALPGKRTLLEPFKLTHREIDVVTAREEAAHKQLDSARRAMRLTGANPDLDDPVDRSHHHPLPGADPL